MFSKRLPFLIYRSREKMEHRDLSTIRFRQVDNVHMSDTKCLCDINKLI